MRKLISLLLAVVMVMGLATVAFATTDAGDYCPNSLEEVPASITLGAGETASYTIFDMMGTMTGSVMTVKGENGHIYAGMVQGFTAMNPDNTASVTLEAMRGMISFSIVNEGTAEATYEISFAAPLGSRSNPAPVQAGTGIIAETDGMSGYVYNFKYTAGNTPETVTISNVAILAGDEANIVPSVALYSDSMADAVLENGVATIDLYAGESVIITVTLIESDYSTAWGMAVASFDLAAVEAPVGARVNPIEVDAAGDYVVEGDEVWYAVNSRLAGYIIAVQGDNATLVVGEDTINAVDGLATAVLNGNGAVIPVAVYNATDMIIMPAPTEISAAGDYTADVAAGAEVEFAVNSRLAGAILTVEGKDAYILIGTTKYQAVDGVATAVLDGEGATIAVKIGNAGTAAAQYKLNIAYAPTAINAVGDYKVTLAPGAEAEYVVNSKLDGAVVTVKGEGAYLIVDGKKIEGKDGVVTATLEAKAATISLIVGNAGKTTGEWTINVALNDNPKTGDFGMIAAVAVMAMSAIGGTAVIAKKKEN